MKPTQRFPRLPAGFLLVLAFVVYHLAFGVAFAGFPRPSFILYGQALDPFGWPYTTNATVNLKVNGRVLKSHAITGSIVPGINFILRLPLDVGGGLLYDSLAARPGDPLQITIAADGREWPISTLYSYITLEELLGLAQPPRLLTNSPAAFPRVGQPGDIVGLNITAGTDLDGDGLPDEWEQWIIYNDRTFGLLTPWDVRPEDDFDGDGMSNLAEYLAGTDPTWDRDYFFIEELERTSTGRLELRWLTIPGRSYRIWSASIATGPVPWQWQSCPFAQSPTAAMQTGWFEGTGYFMAIFVEATDGAQVFRVEVK